MVRSEFAAAGICGCRNLRLPERYRPGDARCPAGAHRTCVLASGWPCLVCRVLDAVNPDSSRQGPAIDNASHRRSAVARHSMRAWVINTSNDPPPQDAVVAGGAVVAPAGCAGPALLPPQGSPTADDHHQDLSAARLRRAEGAGTASGLSQPSDRYDYWRGSSHHRPLRRPVLPPPRPSRSAVPPPTAGMPTAPIARHGGPPPTPPLCHLLGPACQRCRPLATASALRQLRRCATSYGRHANGANRSPRRPSANSADPYCGRARPTRTAALPPTVGMPQPCRPLTMASAAPATVGRRFLSAAANGS